MTDVAALRPLRSRLFVAAVASAGVAVDALSKSWATSALSAGEPLDVVGSFLRFDLAFNSGMAFSQFRGGGPVLSLVAAAAITGILWYAGRVRSVLLLTGLGLVCGGAAGNLVDRIFREPGAMEGRVVDFIQLPNWPTFNVADMLLAFGVVLVLVATFRNDRAEADVVAERGTSVAAGHQAPMPDPPGNSADA